MTFSRLHKFRSYYKRGGSELLNGAQKQENEIEKLPRNKHCRKRRDGLKYCFSIV